MVIDAMIAGNGAFAIYRIDGKEYTTLNDIEGMKETCGHARPKALPPEGEGPANGSGSSGDGQREFRHRR